MKHPWLLLLITGALLFSCQTASGPASNPDATPEGKGQAVAAESSGRTRIAILLPTETGPEPMAEEAMIGINRLVQEFKGTVISRDQRTAFGDGPLFEVLPTPSGSSPERAEAITDRLEGFALGEYDLVIGVGFHYIDPFKTLCAAYPDTDFVGLDFVLEAYGDNLTTLEWDMRDVAFMAGAVAAERFPGETVAALGGFDLDFIRDGFIEPFLAGVRYMDGKTGSRTEVLVDYIGSFTDPEEGYRAAQSIFARGAKLIYEAAGMAGTGVHRAGGEVGKLVIAVDTDRGLDAALEGKPYKHILTSTVKRWDEGIYLTAREYLLTGSLPKGNQIIGMAEGCAELAVNPYNAPILGDQLETIETMKKQLLSGGLDTTVDTSRKLVWESVKAPEGAEIITIAAPALSPDLPDHYGDLLREALFTEFLSSGGYKVLSRDHLESLVGEIKFSLDALSDEKQSLEVGRLAAAKAIVFVNLSTLGESLNLDCKLVAVETGLALSAVRKTYPGVEAAVDDLGAIVVALSE